jgi:hypothetical protein
MSAERFTEFMKGFFAANQLMNRAGNKGCFVEYVCLATSIVDGLLRMGLVLKHQLDSHSSEIPTELIYQAYDAKIISERIIYKKALEKFIIAHDHFVRLKDLYTRRNKVVHRYIISEITTDQVLQIASDYQEIIDVIEDQIRQLENQQIESSVGITVSGRQVPNEVRSKGKAYIQEMADEKHGHPKLAENLKSTSNTNDN